MTETTKSMLSSAPQLVIFSILLVVEYWIFMTHTSSLFTSGDYGALVGIPLIMSLVILILVALGLISVSQKRTQHERIASISLILFVVQMTIILIEYIVIASNM